MANNESKIQSKIINTINKEYGICFKYNEDYKTKAGVPDLFAAINNKAIFIETKTNEGHASEIQKAQIKKIKSKGTKYVYIVNPKNYNDFINILDKIKKGDI